MLLIISILFVFVFCMLLHKQIKKYANVFYVLAILISIGFIVAYKMELYNHIPQFAYKYFVGIFSRGAISIGIFTIVMYMGVLSKKSSLLKVFMPIRAELSIIACIFTLGHNTLYGMFYFPELFTNPGAMPALKLIATLLTIILILIMIPLMVTSFPGVRSKMNFKKWKKLQRMSYLFYALIYVHVMCLFVPKIQKGALFEVVVYSIVFASYLILRVYRYSQDKKSKQNREEIPAI